MDKYINSLIDKCNRLEKLIDFDIKFSTLVQDFITANDSVTASKLLIALSKALNIMPKNKDLCILVAEINDVIFAYYGYRQLCGNNEKNDNDTRTLNELLDDLDSLVGLKNIKMKISDLIAYQKIQKEREKYNLHSTKNTLHMAFTGNPGTGKTTVARIVGRIYKQLGILSKGHFIEASRTDLIAGYQGQTAQKVKTLIEKAKGGVLFIDEAYSITENDHTDSYGRECLTELTKALEDYRDDLVVIVAGYTKPMNKFFDSNPGLKSRFNIFLEFDDYNVEELTTIFEMMCKNNDYYCDKILKEKIMSYFVKKIDEKGDNFANGRLARNLYENMVMNQARRLSSKKQNKKEELKTFIVDDFVENV